MNPAPMSALGQKLKLERPIELVRFTCRRLPKLYNLRMDPYERADITSNTYWDWTIRHAFLAVPTQALVGDFIATFKEFPPRQTPSSFSVDQIMEQLKKPQGS